MNIRKTILYTTLFSIGMFTTALPVEASGSNCTPIYGMYGGGYTSTSSCAKIIIDKKVLKPGTNEYVDGLTGNDPKYVPGQEVTFQIVVKNVGQNKLEKIVVTDTLPQYVTFVSGPGSYDKDTNKISFVVGVLESGASETIYIKTKIADTVNFAEKDFACVTNNVNATVKDVASVDDSTLFCIERTLKVGKPVLGVKQAPATGPEAMILPILMGMGGAGMYLRRKTK